MNKRSEIPNIIASMQYQMILLRPEYEESVLSGLFSEEKSLIDMLPVRMDFLEYQSVIDILNYTDQYHFVCENPYGVWIVFIQKIDSEHYGCFYWDITNSNAVNADKQMYVSIPPTAIFLTNTKGFIIWANKHGERQSEFTLTELLGNKLDNTVLSDLRDKRTAAYIKKAMKNLHAYETDVIMKNKNGENYWARMIGVPHFDELGNLERWVIGFYSIESEKSRLTSVAQDKAVEKADCTNLKRAIDSLVDTIAKVDQIV